MKKIDHCYEYFDTDKFIKFIDAPINKECDVNDFCGIVIECIDGYNHKTGIDEGFIDLLTDLIKSGEFFTKIKKDFSINDYYRMDITDDGMWMNEAYSLYCKRDKFHRLICFEYAGSQISYFLLDRIADNKIRRIRKYSEIHKRLFTLRRHEIHLPVLNKFHEKNYKGINDEMLENHEWSGSPRFDNGKNFYKKYHKEALEVAHE
tara:strand:- start:7 stop:621 length:615 start_codon:yes stop_codon:yes gene_type:complete